MGKIPRVEAVLLGNSRCCINTVTEFLPLVRADCLWELWSWVRCVSAVPVSHCVCCDSLTCHCYSSAASNSVINVRVCT